MLDLPATPDAVAVLGTLGAILPLITSLLKRPGWTDSAKRIFALAVAGVAGVAYTAVQTGDLLNADPAQIASNAVLVWVAAQTAFAHLWRGTAIETRLAGSDPTPKVTGSYDSSTPPL